MEWIIHSTFLKSSKRVVEELFIIFWLYPIFLYILGILKSFRIINISKYFQKNVHTCG